MVFTVGEMVVYPRHGAALVWTTQTRVVRAVENKRLLARARRILVSEMALTEGVGQNSADGHLDEGLAS